MFKRSVKILLLACLAGCLTTGMAWAADSPFIGAWKLNPAESRMPDEMKVTSAGGKYAFDFGGVAETIAVDGTFQPGYGGTLLSVKAAAPDTWIVERKQNGRLVLRATWKLSKDGTTLADYFRAFQLDGSTLSMDYVYARNGGGSGFSGDWRSIKETMNSPFLLQVKAFQGDGLSFVTPSQHTVKNVKLDGKDYPREGAGTYSSARGVDARNLVITDKAAGKITDTEEVGLSSNGKALTMTVHIPGRAKPNVMVFERE